MDDELDDLLLNLNDQYRIYFGVKKSAFKPFWSRKVIDYDALLPILGDACDRLQDIDASIQVSSDIQPTLKEFSQSLRMASIFLYSYIHGRVNNSDYHTALDSLFAEDKRLNKLADKTWRM